MQGHVREDAQVSEQHCCAFALNIHRVAQGASRPVRPVMHITDMIQLGGASSGGERHLQCSYAPHDCRAANGLREAEFSLWPPLEKGIHEFKWKPAGTQSDYRLFRKNEPIHVVSRRPSIILTRNVSRF